VEKKILEVLNNISTEEFQKCFQQWEKRWYKCIESKGEYFEGYWCFNSMKPYKPLKKSPFIFGNVPDFGSVFLKLKYTDITKNTYIQS